MSPIYLTSFGVSIDLSKIKAIEQPQEFWGKNGGRGDGPRVNTAGVYWGFKIRTETEYPVVIDVPFATEQNQFLIKGWYDELIRVWEDFKSQSDNKLMDMATLKEWHDYYKGKAEALEQIFRGAESIHFFGK